MHAKSASKRVAPVKAAKKAKAPVKQPKRAIKTAKKVVKKPLKQLRGFANLKTPDQLTPEELAKYNQAMPSSAITEGWEAQLDQLNNDVLDQTLSTEVEEYLLEHGDTPNLWSAPAAVQYNIFRDDPQFEISKRLIGPAGTIEDPTMVFTPKPYRIVGCVGTLDNPHPLNWFSMEGYIKHLCPDCGQIFQLTNNPDDCDFSYNDKVDNMSHFAPAH